MQSDDEVYPKSPLNEVVFEIRFPGEPSIECHRDELFDVVRSRLPKVRVPGPAADDNFRFRTYQFVSNDDAYTVMAGLNLLAYSSKRYTGFADFSAQLKPVFDFFCKRFKIGPLRRVGFRYINAIPFTRENGAVPIARYFKSKFMLSPGISDSMELCSIGLVQNLENGHIMTRIETMKAQNGEESLLLDFDHFKTEGLNADKLTDYLEESHSQAKTFFENIITDQYRDFIRGRPLL